MVDAYVLGIFAPTGWGSQLLQGVSGVWGSMISCSILGGFVFRYSTLKKMLPVVGIFWLVITIGIGVYQRKLGVDGVKPMIVIVGLLTVLLFYLVLALVFTAIRISTGLSMISSSVIENQMREGILFSLFLSSDYKEIIDYRKSRLSMGARHE